MSSSGRLIAIVGALVVLVVAFVVLKPGDDEPASTTGAPVQTQSQTQPQQQTETKSASPEAKPAPFKTIVVRAAKPVGGVEEIDVKKGDRVRLRVTSSDTTDHIHIHGYDLTKNLAPGRQARFVFDADADGIYEIELEDAGVPIAELTVEP